MGRPSKFRLPWGLNLQIATPFLVFVVLGSSGLAYWLQTNFQRLDREAFASLARTNAEFIQSSRLACSQQTANDLGRVLNVRVYFRSKTGGWTPPIPSGVNGATLKSLVAGHGSVRLNPRNEAVAVTLDADNDLVFVRAARKAAGIFRPATLLVFGVFWGLTLALAITLSRGIARPLRLLAAELPRIGDDGDRTLPGADRHDEIGSLARAYLATHLQLVEERAARETAERLAVLGKMTASLAHEIHNPLAGIRLHLQLLASTPPDRLDESVAEAVPILLGEAAEIETLVNQWMFLVRPTPPQTSPVDLAALVRSTLQLLQPVAAHARVEFSADVPVPLRIEADARRISQVCRNIILNAIQAMPLGGTLRVEGRVDGPAAVLTFHDTGRGFSAAASSRYAELFFSEKEGGMGIGLSVVSEIIKAHHGALQIGNGPVGAVVTVVLPLSVP